MTKTILVALGTRPEQEEAPSFGVPVLVLRLRTERLEAIQAGLAEVVGVDEDRIVVWATDLLARSSGAVARAISNPFGYGRATQRIVDVLASSP